MLYAVALAFIIIKFHLGAFLSLALNFIRFASKIASHELAAAAIYRMLGSASNSTRFVTLNRFLSPVFLVSCESFYVNQIYISSSYFHEIKR